MSNIGYLMIEVITTNFLWSMLYASNAVYKTTQLSCLLSLLPDFSRFGRSVLFIPIYVDTIKSQGNNYRRQNYFLPLAS